MNKKAIIAMSGGVDSSVAAYLMVQQGYDCAGATLKLYDNPQCSYPGHRACCTPSDTEDARSVAARLGMLYYVFPMQEKFHQSVIDKFADTYLHGGTPNPCIDCNRFLKFSALLDKARELGCEYIASGHYARREQDPKTGRFLLRKCFPFHRSQTLARLLRHLIATYSVLINDSTLCGKAQLFSVHHQHYHLLLNHLISCICNYTNCVAFSFNIFGS